MVSLPKFITVLIVFIIVSICALSIAEADWVAKAAVYSLISARFAKLQSLKIAFFKLLNLLL